jgi:hypothetical protein
VGFLALAAGFVLLAAMSVRLAAVLAAPSAPVFLLAAYTFAYGEVVAISLALSPARLVTPRWLLVTLAGLCAATWLATRGRSRTIPLRRWFTDLRTTASDPLLAILGFVVLAGLAYAVVLTLTTPQNDIDTLYDHLWRAALWRQNHAVGYPQCSCAGYINGYPPNGEMQLLFTMVLGSTDRYVGLVQSFGFMAVVVGVAAVARRIGLARREALFGGLLMGTLPIVALQASTGQNDLDVAALLLAATVFLFDGRPVMPWLAGIATCLAVGTKVDAPFAIPLLLAVAVVAQPRARRLVRIAAVLAGSALGGYWYLVNLAETGSLYRSFREYVDHSAAAITSRIMLFGIQFVDLAGAIGRDRWLYWIVGVVIAVGFVVYRRRLATPPRAVGEGIAVVAITLFPLLLAPFSHLLYRAYIKTWEVLGNRRLAYIDPGREITRSASNWSWYGPLGSLLLVVGAIVVWRAVRRRQLPPIARAFALAPVYWLVAFSILAFYQLFAGRFFMYSFALATATWGIFYRTRAVASGIAVVAALTMFLALVNDYKRPSGLRLISNTHLVSIWSTPRWVAQGRETHDPDVLRYADAHLGGRDTVALLLVPHYNGYVFLGRGLDRHIDLIGPQTHDAPGAKWAFVYPGGTTSLCARDWRLVSVVHPGWQVFKREASGRCS